MWVKVFKIKFQGTWFFIFTEHNIDVECICSMYKLNIAGWSSLVARRAHNPKVVGSNPAPATISLEVLNSDTSSFLALFVSSFCIKNGFMSNLICTSLLTGARIIIYLNIIVIWLAIWEKVTDEMINIIVGVETPTY